MEIKLDPEADTPAEHSPQTRLALVFLLMLVFILVTSVKLGKKRTKSEQNRA